MNKVQWVKIPSIERLATTIELNFTFGEVTIQMKLKGGMI